MKIAWMYLDKKAAAINALKDYANMARIIQKYEDDIRETRAHLTSIQTPELNGITGKADPGTMENKAAMTLDLIDVVEKRYRHAQEYMAWFQPAWAELTETEQLILTSFCLREDVSYGEAVQHLGALLGLEKTALYVRKDKAARHLALMLYGI